MEPVEGHDGSEVEERQVEVELQELQDAEVSVVTVAVFQSKTDAAHDGETAAAVEQNRTQREIAARESGL